MARSDRDDRGKMASLTGEGIGLSSNVEGDGCYGEWEKRKQLLLPNTLDSEKNTTTERVGQDMTSLVMMMTKKHGFLFNTTLSARAMGLGQAQINIAKRNLLGSGQLLGLGQAQTKNKNSMVQGLG